MKADYHNGGSELNKRPARKIPYFLIIIILLVSFGVYFNTLFNGFVYDDKIQILDNQWIKDIKYIPQIFFKDVWGFQSQEVSSYYRPLMNVVYMLNYHIFRLKPWGFHLVNIIFHVGVSVVVFFIIKSFLKGNQPISYLSSAFIAALLFAVHPIHTEPVAFIGANPELSFTLFYLLSFYLYMHASAGDRLSKGLYILSVASFFLAALCKEPALTLPVILVAYDYAFRKSSISHRPLDYLKRYIPYLVAGGVYFIFRIYTLRSFVPFKGHTELSIYQSFINIFPLFIKYLEKLILPLNLNVFHVFHPIISVFEPKAIISIILTLAFIVSVYIALKKNKTVFFSLLLIVVPLLPAFYIPALGDNVFTERYLYLPSVGFVMLLCLLTEWVREKRTGWFKWLIVGFFILAGLYSAGTISRNRVWKDNYTLWMDSVKKSPDGAIPHNNLGLAYSSKGLIDKAIGHYQIALRLDNRHAKAYNNLGAAYGEKGQIDKAIEHFQNALTLKPDYADAHNNIGIAYGSKGLSKKAIERFQLTLKLKPEFADAYHNLGVTYMNIDMVDKAIEHFQAALRLNPDNANTHLNLANAYMIKGWTEKAEEHRRLATSLQKDNL